jgi:hypothetical protein
MRNLKVSRKNAASMIAVLCICLLLVTMVGFLFSDSIDNFTNDVRIYLGLGQQLKVRELSHLNLHHLLLLQFLNILPGKTNSFLSGGPNYSLAFPLAAIIRPQSSSGEVQAILELASKMKAETQSLFTGTGFRLTLLKIGFIPKTVGL